MDETFSSITGHSAKTAVTRQIREQQLGTYAPSQERESDGDDPPVENKKHPNLLTSMVAGAAAGIVVDISLFPLDTLKTRLQSKDGFQASGGFRQVYKGIGPVLLGSAPISALFFGVYNSSVNYLKTDNPKHDVYTHVAGASIAEIIGASIRVPLEIIKQRKQISQKGTKSLDIVRKTLLQEGLPGMYRGFLSTISREVPFAAIQFPLWEFFKEKFRKDNELSALKTAYCGAAAGGVAAALTTPMDVIKTRIMLAEKEQIYLYERFLTYHIAVDILHERGIAGFFAGVVPRVLWITLGGFIYFGMYEKTKNICETHHITVPRNPEAEKILSLKKEEKESQLKSTTAPSYTDVIAQKFKEKKGKLKDRIKKKLEDMFSPKELEESGEDNDSNLETKWIDEDWEINIGSDFDESELPKS